MNIASVAYCAGLIDGEGCLRVKRVEWTRYRSDRQTPGFHASIAVKMVERGALERLAELFGGTVRIESRAQANRRILYVWGITDQKAEDAARVLLPYLIVKKRQAELIIRLRELQRDGRNHRTKVVGHREFPNSRGTMRVIENRCFSDAYIAGLEALAAESKILNAVGDAAI